MNYEESVAYLSGLVQFGPRLGRERFRELLSRLGDPHERFRCFHVAGTNGKGSTTTFLASILRAAGYRVGAYLSPYVFDLRERIVLDGAMIPRDDFARHVTAIRPHIEAIAAQTELGQTTEFELKTAVAFRHFAEQSVDFAVVEVGIGGRLDATNVIPPPLVAVITSIGYDHKNLLGDTLGEIAGEKAGILKSGTLACVTAVPPGEARDVIAAKAAEQGVPLIGVEALTPPAPLSQFWGRGGGEGEGVAARIPFSSLPELGEGPGVRACYTVTDAHAGRARLTIPGYDAFDVRLGLRGPFQAANAACAATAIGVADRAGFVRVSPESLRRGLEGAALPGRFQVVREGGADAPSLVLDVAHNEDGARVLVEALRATFGAERAYTFVVGLSRAHDPAPFLAELKPIAGRVVATAPQFRPRPASDVAEAASLSGIPAEVVEPAAGAIAKACSAAQPGEVVVVTGSFYTVGETPLRLFE